MVWRRRVVVVWRLFVEVVGAVGRVLQTIGESVHMRFASLSYPPKHRCTFGAPIYLYPESTEHSVHKSMLTPKVPNDRTNGIRLQPPKTHCRCLRRMNMVSRSLCSTKLHESVHTAAFRNVLFNNRKIHIFVEYEGEGFIFPPTWYMSRTGAHYHSMAAGCIALICDACVRTYATLQTGIKLEAQHCFEEEDTVAVG